MHCHRKQPETVWHGTATAGWSSKVKQVILTCGALPVKQHAAVKWDDMAWPEYKAMHEA